MELPVPWFPACKISLRIEKMNTRGLKILSHSERERKREFSHTKDSSVLSELRTLLYSCRNDLSGVDVASSILRYSTPNPVNLFDTISMDAPKMMGKWTISILCQFFLLLFFFGGNKHLLFLEKKVPIYFITLLKV